MRRLCGFTFSLVLVSTLLCDCVEGWEASPTINTTAGPIYGYINRFGTYTFRGVPYAKPPVGQRRFANPEPMDLWSAPLNASEFAPGCYQDCHTAGKYAPLLCAPSISEDCLYLNINTPTLNTSARLPVVFFIHGGMFTWGAGGIPLYDGSLWGIREQIILVTINYRLNIFGALYTGPDAVTGNFNLLDQREAMRWVYENIENFGGDPTRITISGQSAGATSVGMHLASPGSWKYFSRAAVISNPYGLIPVGKDRAAELGDVVLLKLGCFTSGHAQLECLRNKTAAELFAASKTEYLPTPNEVLALLLQWSPTVDGVVLPMQPITAVEQGSINPVPLYIGTVANESVPFVDGISVDDFELDVAIAYIFGLDDAVKVLEVYAPQVSHYQNDTIWLFSKILTDYLFYCPSMHVASAAAQFNGNRSFTYFFDEHPSWAAWYTNNGICSHYICHAFDLPSIFASYYEIPADLHFPSPTPAEQNMTQWVQHAWGEFAHHGRIHQWPEHRNDQHLTYNISLGVPNNNPAILDGFRAPFCDVFNALGYNRH